MRTRLSTKSIRLKRLTKPEAKRSDFKAPPTYGEPFTWSAEHGVVIAQRPGGQRYRTREAVLAQPGDIDRESGPLVSHNDIAGIARRAKNAIDFIYRLNTHLLTD